MPSALTILTMRIESLKTTPDRMGRYWAKFSDGSSLALYRQTVEDFGLYTGLELEPDRLEALKTAAGQMSAKMRAVRIVSASSVSKRDLEQRLIRKGEDPDQARAAVDWMADLDLLDDRETARQVVASCVRKGYGLQRAKQALYEKKIPKHLWEEALEEYPDQTEKIVEFLRQRLGREWAEKDLKRAIDAALRRGHSYSEIRGALKLLEADNDEFLEEF